MSKEDRKYIAVLEHNKEVVKKAKEIGDEIEQRSLNTQHPIRTCVMVNNLEAFITYLSQLPEQGNNDTRYFTYFEVFED